MIRYEYRCTDCGDTIITDSNEDAGRYHDSKYGGVSDRGQIWPIDRCGPLKRVWSAGFVWPMSERGHD